MCFRLNSYRINNIYHTVWSCLVIVHQYIHTVLDYHHLGLGWQGIYTDQDCYCLESYLLGKYIGLNYWNLGPSFQDKHILQACWDQELGYRDNLRIKLFLIISQIQFYENVKSDQLNFLATNLISLIKSGFAGKCCQDSLLNSQDMSF